MRAAKIHSHVCVRCGSIDCNLNEMLRSEIVRRETEILFEQAVWQAGSKRCTGETFKIVLHRAHSSSRVSSLQLCAEEHIGRT